MASKKSHGVALLGAGLFSKSAHLPAVAAASTLSIKAIYSRSSESSLALLDASRALPELELQGDIATYWDKQSDGEARGKCSGDLQALLARDDIETVILSLPILVQPDVIRAAFKAGKNVISEKPISKDVASSLALIEEWEGQYKSRCQWIIAEQFPYEESYVQAKKMILEGKIGELRRFSFDSAFFITDSFPYLKTAWRKFCLDGGVHWAAGLRFMLPTPLTAISADTRQIQAHLPPIDTIQGLARTESGATGTFTISLGTESAGARSYTFWGSHARLEVAHDNQGKIVTTLHPRRQATPAAAHGVDDVVRSELPDNQAVKAEFEAFGHALLAGPGSEIAGEVDRRSGPRAALKDVEFIEASIKSGESGGWVTLQH